MADVCVCVFLCSVQEGAKTNIYINIISRSSLASMGVGRNGTLFLVVVNIFEYGVWYNMFLGVVALLLGCSGL